jgi:hypothetical protein
MFDNILNLFRYVDGAPRLAVNEERLHDPLSHPAIRRMSPEELADLPMRPVRRPSSAAAGLACPAGRRR